MQPEDDKFKPMDEQRTLLEVGSESKDLKATPSAPAPAAAAKPTSPGAQAVDIHFGNVRATQLLGQGGMGKVYKGHHEGLDIDVAIKVMSGDLAKDLTARQRFMREARTAAKLDHPNVVRVLTVDEQDGAPYIVMEFVDGADMAALVKQAGRLNPVAVLQALAQVADGLGAAHEQGIIHRDIKPHNIFVARTGRVKLGDFGLARATEQTTELTMPGSAMGTAHYMSPEQAQGQELGPKSDIYSLGITAYHLLSGQTPYSGSTPLSIAVQHVNNDVPYDRARFGHVPDPAVYLLMAMTQRDPNRRPSAAEAARDLRRILVQLTGRDDVKLPNLEALTSAATTMAMPPVAPNMARTVVPPGAAPMARPPQAFAPAVAPRAGLQTPPGFAASVPPAAMPIAPAAVPMAPAQPPVSSVTPQGLPPHAPAWQPPPEKSSNTLLWVAVGVVLFVVVFFVGCGALMNMR